MITIKDVRHHIRMCLRRRYTRNYNFLGLVENKELSPDVERLFDMGGGWWNWVNGNSKMAEIIAEEEERKGISDLEKMYRRLKLDLTQFK
jgi:hypothetical protein